MIVVADTSPLNYLVQMNREEVLREIYQSVVIPPAVLAELNHTGAPAKVQVWAANPPAWVSVLTGFTMDASLPAVLGAGEREAISLAMAISATFILLDDDAGRRAAQKRSLIPAGTLAVLLQASRRGLFPMEAALAELKALEFRMSEELEKHMLHLSRKL